MKALPAALIALAIALPAAGQTDDRHWMFSESEETAELVYGQPESDDVGAVISCAKGSGQIDLYLTFDQRLADSLNARGEWQDAAGRSAPWPVPLTLSAGKMHGTFDAVGHPDEMNGGTTVVYERPASDPMFQAMASSGRFKAAAFGETVAPPPFRSADMRRLLARCAGV